MPGYTKKELEAKGARISSYTYCPRCRRYWHNSDFKKHVAAGHPKVVVKIAMPPARKLKKGDIAIIHPAWQNFIRFAARAMLKRWQREQAAGTLPPAPVPAPARKPIRNPGYEIITVEEAVSRFGESREEIMARFDKIMDDFVASHERATARRRRAE